VGNLQDQPSIALEIETYQDRENWVLYPIARISNFPSKIETAFRANLENIRGYKIL
jgi:hypothetical protein